MEQLKTGSSVTTNAHGSMPPPEATDGFFLLRLAAGGATTLEIAEQVGCSERTVKRRIEEVVTRLGARNRTQAVAIAIRKGLI